MPGHPHLDALHRAVAAAGAHEREVLEALADGNLDARLDAGVAWPRLRVESVSHAGRDHVELLLRAPRGVSLHEGLGAGDRVEVVVGDRVFDGRIRDAAESWAEVRVRGRLDDEGGSAVVTRVFDPTSWRRIADALARADGHDSLLRDVLLGEREPGAPTERTPDLPDPELNASQLAAGHAALAAAEVALVHGPPGTGKTRLLVSILGALVASGDRPWALADSNAAVDHLAVRAAGAGLDVVRVGAWGRMGPRGRALALRTRVAAGPYGVALAALDKDLRRLGGRSDGESKRAWWRLARERRELRERAEAAALESAQLIATTLGTLAWRAPHLPEAHTAVVDEATQALEPSVWTAVPFVQRLVLVGDPHQLGPVVQLPGSPLERSLLQRLLDPADPAGGRLPLPMLDVQHRMHRDIQALVDEVYGDAYAPHPSVAEHRLCELPGVAQIALTTRPTLWIDTAGADLADEQDPKTRSWQNRGEARLVCAVVSQLREAGVPADAIGVITPYSAQVRLLRAQAALASVEIASVNAFQGREKEVIVASWVRSNPDGEIGFVADPRRLTVALTRARRAHVGIGDAATLGGNPRFAATFEHFATQEAWRSVWESPWLEAAGLAD